MTERGVPVDHTTIYRWVQKYAPELDKQTRWYRQVPDWQASSWRVDETYIRVGGRWCYLYRAITAGGQTLDFYLSPKRNVAAAKRFLAKTLRSNTSAGYPRVISTDKAPSLAKAIAELKAEGVCPPRVEHRRVKYLQRAGRRSWPVKADPGAKRSIQKPDFRLPDSERDGSDALITEGAGHDVCLRATEPGCRDRQPSFRDGLRTSARCEPQRMKDWTVTALRQEFATAPSRTGPTR